MRPPRTWNEHHDRSDEYPPLRANARLARLGTASRQGPSFTWPSTTLKDGEEVGGGGL